MAHKLQVQVPYTEILATEYVTNIGNFMACKLRSVILYSLNACEW